MLYSCETWYFTKREECRLRVSENMILMQIFRPKSDEHGEFLIVELHSLYRSPYKGKWAGHLARIEKGRSAINISTGTSTGKAPLERPRYKWENNVTMYLKEKVVNTRNWVDSTKDRDIGELLKILHGTSGFHHS